MNWAKIATLLEDNGSIGKYIKTDRKWRSPAIGLYHTWDEWVQNEKTDEKQILEALPDVQRALLVLYPNKETLHVNSIKWRSPIAARFGKKTEMHRQSIYELGLTREESLARRENYTKKIREQARNRRVTFTKAQIFAAIETRANSVDFGSNVLAICLATGARVVEALKVTKFEPSPLGDNYIRINGVAKSKTHKIIDRPILYLNSTQLLELIARTRKYKNFAKMTNDEVKEAAIIKVNKAMRALFPDLTAHKSRYIWASLAWRLNAEHIPQQEWVREMLGHETADVSLTYLMYFCDI